MIAYPTLAHKAVNARVRVHVTRLQITQRCSRPRLLPVHDPEKWAAEVTVARWDFCFVGVETRNEVEETGEEVDDDEQANDELENLEEG